MEFRGEVSDEGVAAGWICRVGVGVKVTEDWSWRKFGKVRQQQLRFQRR